MMRKILFPLIFFLHSMLPWGGASAQDADPFVIGDIRVEGIERLDTGIVFRNLDLDIGEQFDPARSGEIIGKLFATGVFRDVVLFRDGDVLVVQVVENPTIAEIGFLGMNEFDEEQILESLAEIDVAASGVLRTDGVERAERLLLDAYVGRAYYAADIEATVTPLDRNRVRIDFEVSEGNVVKVDEVTIYGVEQEDVDEVLEQMTIRPSNWLSWYRKDDVYSGPAFEGDVGRIRDYYLARGYLRFDVLSSEVVLSRERDSIRIVVVVSEGDRYTLSGWDIVGDHEFLEGEEEELDLGLVEGEVFSARKVETAAQRIRRHLGDRSFARATVESTRTLDDEAKTARVEFSVDAGKSVIVRRINISGNNKTRDEVIRRELRQFEGALYSARKLEQSRRRLNRLGLFDRVDFAETEVAGADDQVDVDLDVVETSLGTGSVGFGIGFSREGGVSFSGSFDTKNLFGTGNDFGAEVTFSDTTDRLALNFDQPYVTEYGVSRHFGIARSEINSPDDITEYSLDGTDVDYGYGIPVAEETVLFVSAHYETDEVLNTNLVSRTDQEAQDFLMRHGNDFTSYLMSARLTRDTRDSSLAPTEGFRQSFSTKATLPVGDLRYYTARFLHSHYFPFDEDKDHVLGALGEVSYADSFGGYVYPFYNRYFLGGPSTLRGFESGSVGEKDEDGDALGGKFRIRGSLDYYLPFPLISEFDGVRTSIFTDAGAIFQDASDLEFGELRSSFGVSIRWISPLGPFKFIIATPIQSEDDDRTRSFDFTLGIL